MRDQDQRSSGFPSALQPLAVPLREAARITGLSERKLWQLAKDELIRRVRVGRSVRFLVADLQRFLEDHRK
jgi:excisionase family DNA binding protein